MDELQAAARAILNAGCSGVPALTHAVDRHLNGGAKPSYSPGDASFDSPLMYSAIRAALMEMAEARNDAP